MRYNHTYIQSSFWYNNYPHPRNGLLTNCNNFVVCNVGYVLMHVASSNEKTKMYNNHSLFEFELVSLLVVRYQFNIICSLQDSLSCAQPMRSVHLPPDSGLAQRRHEQRGYPRTSTPPLMCLISRITSLREVRIKEYLKALSAPLYLA